MSEYKVEYIPPPEIRKASKKKTSASKKKNTVRTRLIKNASK